VRLFAGARVEASTSMSGEERPLKLLSLGKDQLGVAIAV
jgi:hypothetical protein